MKVLLIDNFDSFTYNLAQLLEESGKCSFEIRKIDNLSLKDIEPFDKILISPGPGLPEEKPILLELIKHFSHRKSILGICLGHQAVAMAFGAKLKNLQHIKHGESSAVRKTTVSCPLFSHLPDTFEGGRYHSWVVDSATLTESMQVTALCEDGHIMGIQHRNYPVFGLQFHPESILTPTGKILIDNWLRDHYHPLC